MQLGELDPYRMLEAMPARTWALWQTYALVEPWRFADEPVRQYPLEEPEQAARTVRAKFEMLAQLYRGG